MEYANLCVHFTRHHAKEMHSLDAKCGYILVYEGIS